MTLYSVDNPLASFETIAGLPLTAGQVFVGLVNQDPETSPQAVWWDAAGTIPASQPLATKGGYIVRAGTPAVAYTAPPYSIRIRDRFGVEIFYLASVSSQLSDFIAGIEGTGGAGLVGTASGQSVQTVLKYFRSSNGVVKIGYDSVSNTSAAVMIGANDAGAGRGSLQIGGAGPKDIGNGMFLNNDYQPAFSIFQNSMKWGSTEVNYYGNNTGGFATGDGAGHLTLTQGDVWDTQLVGRSVYFSGAPYLVSAVSGDGQTLTLSSGTPSGTHAWNFSLVTGSGTCTVSGAVVTRALGDPFITYGDNYTFKLGASVQTVVSGGGDTITLSAPPGNGTYTYSYATQIHTNGGPLISGSRWQKVAGASEEGVGIFVGPDGYRLQSFASNSGENYPLWLLSSGQEVVECHATAKYVSLGGKAGAEAVRAVWIANSVNWMEHRGGATGVTPSLSSRSATDANTGLNIDMQGAGVLTISSGSFTNTEFAVGGGKMLGKVSNLINAANDAAAAAAGVAISQFYRNGSAVMIRVS